MDDDRRCTATAKSTGERCKRAAVRGSNVCSMHGGKAPQVQQKAQERLDRMADSTTATIQDQISDLQDEYDRAEDPDTKLKILGELRKNWKIVLDRTGHGPHESHTVDGELGVSTEFVEIDDGDE